jgi:hypothetical protein
MAGNEDLGQDIIVDGHHIHYAQKEKQATKLAQIIPVGQENQPGNFLIKERDPAHNPADV